MGFETHADNYTLDHQNIFINQWINYITSIWLFLSLSTWCEIAKVRWILRVGNSSFLFLVILSRFDETEETEPFDHPADQNDPHDILQKFTIALRNWIFGAWKVYHSPLKWITKFLKFQKIINTGFWNSKKVNVDFLHAKKSKCRFLHSPEKPKTSMFENSKNPKIRFPKIAKTKTKNDFQKFQKSIVFDFYFLYARIWWDGRIGAAVWWCCGWKGSARHSDFRNAVLIGHYYAFVALNKTITKQHQSVNTSFFVLVLVDFFLAPKIYFLECLLFAISKNHCDFQKMNFICQKKIPLRQNKKWCALSCNIALIVLLSVVHDFYSWRSSAPRHFDMFIGKTKLQTTNELT